jgi:hypothetical protein
MKKLIFRAVAGLVLLGVLLKPLAGFTQVPGPTGGANSAMIKLFGDLPAFTGNASVYVFNSNRVETLRMPSIFSGLNNNLRVDVDMGLIQSSQLPAASIAKLKQLGLDRLCSVNRPDKKVIYIIYPNARSYVNMPLSKEDADIAGEKLFRTPIARATLDGHACVKNRSVVKNRKGAVLLDAVTWNASDLRDFPLRIEVKENGSTSVTHFQRVSFTKPAPALFDAPAGYKLFSNPLDLTMAAVRNASAGKKK